MWNTEGLQENETKEKFQNAIKILLKQTQEYNNIDSAWENINRRNHKIYKTDKRKMLGIWS